MEGLVYPFAVIQEKMDMGGGGAALAYVIKCTYIHMYATAQVKSVLSCLPVM